MFTDRHDGRHEEDLQLMVRPGPEHECLGERQQHDRQETQNDEIPCPHDRTPSSQDSDAGASRQAQGTIAPTIQPRLGTAENQRAGPTQPRSQAPDEGVRQARPTVRPQGEQQWQQADDTQASYDAKQETHAAYERLREPATPRAEQDRLVDYQRQVNTRVPTPPGALDIPDYP